MTRKRQRKRSNPAAQSGKSRPRRTPTKLTLWKKGVFAVVTAALFFLLLEGLLALGGVRPVLYSDDPYVGFASNIPLFVPMREADGTAHRVTAPNKLRWFNKQRFPEKKPPGSYRIFCLGGSTTKGRPYYDTTSFCGWLRELLPVADPSHPWELINAGGISYASYRVAALMEELIRYEPDLFLIYTGHNEFLERRTYPHLARAPRLVTAAAGWLSRTRSYAMARRTLWGFAGGQAGPSEGASILSADVDAILDRSIGPGDYTRDDDLRKQVMSPLRFNLDRMVDIARSAGAAVAFITPASNLRDCSPFKSEHAANLRNDAIRQFESLMARAREHLDARDFDRALDALDGAAAIDDRYADLHYRRGRVLYESGRHAEAAEAFSRAVDEDICPLRAFKSLRQIVAAVAARRGAPLIDFARLVEGWSEHGIPSADHFLDHVHPTIEANRLLALEIVKHLEAAQILDRHAGWTEAAIDQVVQQVESRIDERAHGTALRNLAKVLAWAGKLEEAERLARQAAELLGDDAPAHELLALKAATDGDLEAAIRHYHRALEIEPASAKAHNNLANVLRLQGRVEEAIHHYRRTLEIDSTSIFAHNNLGTLYESQGRIKEAVTHFRRTLQIDPENGRAHYYMGNASQSVGKMDEALQHYREALRLLPEEARVHFDLGMALFMVRQMEAAMTRLRDAARLEPQWAGPWNTIAQILVHQPQLGEAGEAVRLAERACRLTKFQNAKYASTLADAYAAGGRLEQAVATARSALDLATGAGDDKLVAWIRSRLVTYEQGMKEPQ